MDWRVGAPNECKSDVNEFDYDVDVGAYQQVDNCRHVQREEAVAQQADRLEETDCTAKKLPINCDHSTSDPNDAENDLKEKCLVVGIRGNTQHTKEKKMTKS